MADLYPFQRKAVIDLLGGKHIIYAVMGAGKTATALKWAEQEARRSGKNKLLVITTASKSKSSDWEDEAKKFTPELKLNKFEVVSWHKAKQWTRDKTPQEMSEYLVIFDELHRSKQGVSSLMGRAFLMLTKYTDTWVGATGTPGDKWIDFCPYFVATKKVRNKTHFEQQFCVMQHYPYPAVLSYKNTDQLKEWWDEISTAPDTSEVMAELPSEVHKVITLPTPKGYKKCIKNSTTLEGEFLDSNIALAHYARQLCASPDKLTALSDTLNSLSSPLVIFYNYTCEREQILELARKIKRKVWRVDGECHEIPTEDTIGKDDIVLCHYLSGSEALNLQFCHYWLSYSYNYSYSTSQQARGRIKRIGQKHPMFYWYLECEGTIEQDVKKCLRNKSDFAEETWRLTK